MFVLRMMALRLEIVIAVIVIAVVSHVFALVPDFVWYPLLQLTCFTLLILAASYYASGSASDGFYMFSNSSAKHLIDNPMYAVLIAVCAVLFINFIQALFGEGTSPGCTVKRREQFVGDADAIGKTPVILGDPFCPPKLDFKNMDSDNESQTNETQSQACVSNPNRLTEEEELDKIDIYLRDSQQSIARINNYLNVIRPDERWLSKAEMDKPENKKITA